MKKIYLGTLLFIISILLLNSKILANTINFTENPNSSNSAYEAVGIGGITISPLVSTLVISKGQTIYQNITVYNNNKRTTTLSLRFSNFTSRNPFGDPQFQGLTDKATISDQSLNINTVNSITVQPGQSKNISIEITAKQNAEPGEDFIAAFVLSQGESTSNININSAVGSLFLIRINGAVKESGFIKSFTETKNIYLSTPIIFNENFENTGNVHLIPQGEIQIYNIFGNEVATIPVNVNRGIVLPIGVNERIFTQNWNPSNFLLGKYTAKLYLTYGTNSVTTVEATSSFWIIPLWFIIIIIVIITVIIIWQILSRIQRQKYY